MHGIHKSGLGYVPTLPIMPVTTYNTPSPTIIRKLQNTTSEFGRVFRCKVFKPRNLCHPSSRVKIRLPKLGIPTVHIWFLRPPYLEYQRGVRGIPYRYDPFPNVLPLLPVLLGSMFKGINTVHITHIDL